MSNLQKVFVLCVIVGLGVGLFLVEQAEAPHDPDIQEYTPPNNPPPAGGVVEIYDDVYVPQSNKSVILADQNMKGSLKAEVRLLSQLEYLDLSHNEFTGLPAEIGQLTNLKVLDLSYNQFTGLPHELGNLHNLERLVLTGNNVSSFDLEVIANALPETTTIVTDKTTEPDPPVACTMEAKMCPDGSFVGRTGPNCEFAACPSATVITCTEAMKQTEACTMIYQPVCGQVQVQCVTAPCDPVLETFSNGCMACAQGNVISYTPGQCAP